MHCVGLRLCDINLTEVLFLLWRLSLESEVGSHDMSFLLNWILKKRLLLDDWKGIVRLRSQVSHAIGRLYAVVIVREMIQVYNRQLLGHCL